MQPGSKKHGKEHPVDSTKDHKPVAGVVADNVVVIDPVTNLPVKDSGVSIGSITGSMKYQGTWDASTNTPTLLNTDTGKQGFVYRCNVAGTVDFGAGNIYFNIGDRVANNGTIWDKWDAADLVTSVFGRLNDVLPVAGDYDASQVDNDSSVPGAFVKDALDNLDDLTSFVTQSNVYFVSDDKGNAANDGSFNKPVKTHQQAITLGRAAGLDTILIMTDTAKAFTYPNITVPDNTYVSLNTWEGVISVQVIIDKITVGDGSYLSINNHTIQTIKESASCTYCQVFIEESFASNFRNFAETIFPPVMEVHTRELYGAESTLTDLINIREHGAGWSGTFQNATTGQLHSAGGFALSRGSIVAYTSDLKGDDTDGDGTQDYPFKTVQKAIDYYDSLIADNRPISIFVDPTGAAEAQIDIPTGKIVSITLQTGYLIPAFEKFGTITLHGNHTHLSLHNCTVNTIEQSSDVGATDAILVYIQGGMYQTFEKEGGGYADKLTAYVSIPILQSPGTVTDLKNTQRTIGIGISLSQNKTYAFGGGSGDWEMGGIQIKDIADGVLASDVMALGQRYTDAEAEATVKANLSLVDLLSPPITKTLYADVNRVDAYTEDGSEEKPYKTAQAAVNVVSGATTIILELGTYNEDIVLKPGAYLRSRSPTAPYGVVINGKISWAAGAGNCLLTGIYVYNTTDHALEFSGSDAMKLRTYNCKFQTNSPGAHHAYSHSNTNPGSELHAKDSLGQVQDSSGGAECIHTVATSQGTIGLHHTTLRILDDIDAVAADINGAINYWHTMDKIYGRVKVALTATATISLLAMYANTLSCLDTNSMGNTILSNIMVSTTASPAITGAGALAYSGVTYVSTGSGLAGTLNGGLGPDPGAIPFDSALNVIYDPTASGLTATRVKTAIDEIANDYQKESEKDQVNGYPGLDGSGLINSAQLPSIAITDTHVVASEVAQLALTVQKGDIAVRSDQNKSYVNSTGNNVSMADWQELLTPTDTVLSVDARTGVVTLNDLYEPLDAAIMKEGENVSLLTNDSDFQSGTQVDTDITTHKNDASAHHTPPSLPADIEDGGSTEMSVTGLNGLLADDQHILDTEAVSAMGIKADANPLNHDRPIQATETVVGIAEIATQVETDAGNDDTKMVTPKKLAAYPTGAKTHAPVYYVIWGTSSGLLGGNQTIFMHLGGDPAITSIEAKAQVRMSKCNLKAIEGYCYSIASTATITVRKNGIATALTGTVSATGRFRITGTVAFTDGDLLSVEFTLTAGGGTGFNGGVIELDTELI